MRSSRQGYSGDLYPAGDVLRKDLGVRVIANTSQIEVVVRREVLLLLVSLKVYIYLLNHFYVYVY